MRLPARHAATALAIGCAFAVAAAAPAASAPSPSDPVLRDRTGRPDVVFALDSAEVQRLLEPARPPATPGERPRVERFGFTGGDDSFAAAAALIAVPSYLAFVPHRPEAWVGGGDLAFAAIFGLLPSEPSAFGPWPHASRAAFLLGMSGLGAYQLAHGDEHSDWARFGINVAGVITTVLITDLLFVKRTG